ncbi:MAG: hypothetical protein ACXWO1_18890, partial [Isosphaeraceae bacterium]
AGTQTPCWLLARPCTRPMSDGQIIKVAVHGVHKSVARRINHRLMTPLAGLMTGLSAGRATTV